MQNSTFKLLMITNDPLKAKILSDNGVDRIFVDLEILGKQKRQGHLDTVISKHKISDVAKIKKTISQGEVLVRINPLNNNSQSEIEKVIDNGADIIMLPMFTDLHEIEQAALYINNRAKFIPLIETKKAAENILKIAESSEVDEFYIGLNDLHLDYQLKFMFQLLQNGTLEKITKALKQKNFNFGFGGISRIGHGLLPSENILTEHNRLGSTSAILSRSFCKMNEITDDFIFTEVTKIKNFVNSLSNRNEIDIVSDKTELDKKIKNVIRGLV